MPGDCTDDLLSSASLLTESTPGSTKSVRFSEPAFHEVYSELEEPPSARSAPARVAFEIEHPETHESSAARDADNRSTRSTFGRNIGSHSRRARSRSRYSFASFASHLSRPWNPIEDEEEDQGITWNQVRVEEEQFIKSQDSRRSTDGVRGVPFSVAFSGGGMRAAAFQAGVLWRLAKCNLLKDVDYLAAVSGGGYIASAYASFLNGESPSGGAVQEWYLKVVARTLMRMQENSGNFVRDCVKNPHGPIDGAGAAPRILDLPILLGALALTLLVNPVVFLVCCLLPFSIAIEVFFAAGMRAAFCADRDDWLVLFLRYAPALKTVWLAGFFCVLTFFTWLASKTLPCCQLTKDENGSWVAPLGYVIQHAANAFCVRISVFTVFLLAFVFTVPAAQIGLYAWNDTTHEIKHSQCTIFIAKLKEEQEKGNRDCANFYYDKPWYEDDLFSSSPEKLAKAYKFMEGGESEDLAREKFAIGLIKICCFGFLGLLALSVIIVPVMGSEVSFILLCISGPSVVFVLTVHFVQKCVFLPITGEQAVLRSRRWEWSAFESWSLLLAMVILPLFPWLRASLHTYYKRNLQANFFKGGKDLSFTELLRHPYCPFLILTGTSSDYQPPGDTDVISELYFSPLHTGGDEMGFVRMPVHRSLAKCTALTGAGCLDAISLTMADALTLRFWLEVLNLTWGDYILFERFPIKVIKAISLSKPQYAATLDRLLHFLPCGIIWFLLFLLVYIGHRLGHSSVNSYWECQSEKRLYMVAGTMLTGMLLLSFIPIFPGHDLLASDPLIRQIQQATKYFQVGHRPPRMLYITDGGVKDCTALLQLLRRRRRRILLVLAAADPNDELNVLRTAIREAHNERTAHFFHPRHPHLGVELVFEKYKNDRTANFLHLGISYSWDDNPSIGEVFIVKNRLPLNLQRMPVQPPLTEAEICGHANEGALVDDAFLSEGWGTMTTDDLGPCGCCDCCHTRGFNCGAKFPHGNAAGYMYLSPMWCNSLIRLGYQVSADVVELLKTSTASPQQG